MTSSYRLFLTLFFLFIVQNIYAQSNLDWELQSTNQQSVTLQTRAGEILTVVDFWATWCKPCIKAMPKLQKIYAQYQTKGVNFVGVSVDSPRNLSKVNPLDKSLGVRYPILLDPNSAFMNKMNVNSLPTLLILDAEGNELYRHQGFTRGDEQQIEDAIKKLLAKNAE